MEIRRTEDHSIFQHLVGNRTVARSRVEKIKQSIQKVGYIINPIIVNEKYQIIDGQGREQALAELGMPVDYIVVEGTGINECRSMNIYQSNWRLEDYIYSYAEQGDSSYIRLLHLLKKYKKEGFDIRAIGSVLMKGMGEVHSKIIMEGGIVFTEEDEKEAVECIDWMIPVMDVLRESECGSIKSYIQVLAWCYFNEDIDNDRLVEKVNKRRIPIIPAINSRQAATVIETIYDYSCSKKSFLSYAFVKDTNSNYRRRRALSRQGKE